VSTKVEESGYLAAASNNLFPVFILVDLESFRDHLLTLFIESHYFVAYRTGSDLDLNGIPAGLYFMWVIEDPKSGSTSTIIGHAFSENPHQC
jgi:hypothetical protein